MSWRLGRLEQDHGGTATVSNAPSYTGTTNVSAGTLNFTRGADCPAEDTRSAAARSTSTPSSKSIGTFQITGGTVIGAGSLTSNAVYDIQAGTINAILAGSGIAFDQVWQRHVRPSAAQTRTRAPPRSVKARWPWAPAGSFANSPTISVASLAMLDLTAKRSVQRRCGQTLKGYGTVDIRFGKTIGFAGGGTWPPGGSIGTLNVTGDLDLTGGNAAFELGTPGTSHAAAGMSDRPPSPAT